MPKTSKSRRRVEELLRQAAQAWAQDAEARHLAQVTGGEFYAEVAFVGLARQALIDARSAPATDE